MAASTSPTVRKAVRVRFAAAYPLVTGVAAFFVYAATLAPSITWKNYSSDSGELASTVHALGVAHPPGYPLYILIGRLFSFLPFGEFAWRLNLLSAVLSAATAAVCFYASLLLARSVGREGRTAYLASMMAALLLAFSPMLWSQATVTEVYALNAFLFALSAYFILKWLLAYLDHVARTRYLVAFLATVSVGAANHLTILVALCGLVAAVATRRLWGHSRNARTGCSGRGQEARFKLLAVLLPLAAGPLVYLYLPLRAWAKPAFNWGDPATLDRFWGLVTASEYRYLMFGGSLDEALARARLIAGHLPEQFGWWGLALAGFGMLVGLRRSRPFAAFTIIVMLVLAAYTVAYATMDSAVYMLPGYVSLALWISIGLLEVERLVRRRWEAGAPLLVPVALATLVIIQVAANWRSMDMRNDDAALEYVSSVADALPPNSVLITARDQETFAFWYYETVANWRPDVAVVDARLLRWPWYWDQLGRRYSGLVTADGSQDPLPVRSLVASAYANRPVYLTYTDGSLMESYRLLQDGLLVRLGR